MFDPISVWYNKNNSRNHIIIVIYYLSLSADGWGTLSADGWGTTFFVYFE